MINDCVNQSFCGMRRAFYTYRLCRKSRRANLYPYIQCLAMTSQWKSQPLIIPRHVWCVFINSEEMKDLVGQAGFESGTPIQGACDNQRLFRLRCHDPSRVCCAQGCIVPRARLEPVPILLSGRGSDWFFPTVEIALS